MLLRKPIVIYWFSGTGNTLLIARKMKEVFEKEKYFVTLRKISVSEAVELKGDCHLGIVIPVAIQSTFPVVWEFIDRLPEGNMRQVFFANTMETFSGGIVGPMKKSLKEKGYKCIGACEFKMATSMQTTEKKTKIGEKKSNIALLKVEEYVHALINGRTKWRRIPGLSDAMRSISKGRTIWTKTSESINIEHTLCIQCKLCEKNCPVNAIHLIDQHMKIQHSQCIACMRCVNYCPKNAFSLGEKRLFQKKIVNVSDL